MFTQVGDTTTGLRPEPWTEVAQAWGSLLGVVVAIAGFCLVFYQVRQLRDTIRADTHARIYEHALEVQKLFIERPELRRHFNGDESAEDSQLLAATELVADYLEHIALQSRYVPDHVKEAWSNYTRHLLDKSPSLCKFLVENRSIYSTEFVTFCDLKDYPEGGRQSGSASTPIP